MCGGKACVQKVGVVRRCKKLYRKRRSCKEGRGVPECYAEKETDPEQQPAVPVLDGLFQHIQRSMAPEPF